MDDTPADFALEASAPRRGGKRLPFARRYEDYVGTYGTKVRQLKNWVARGRELTPERLPPLDDPRAMPEWWAAAYPGRNVPEKILAAARAAPEGAVVTAGPASENSRAHTTQAPAPAAGGEPSRRKRREDHESTQGIDLEGSLERLRVALKVAHDQLDDALSYEQPDDGEITMRTNRVNRLAEQMRKVEKDLDERRKAHGELIPRETLRSELTFVFEGLSSSLVPELVASLGISREAALQFADRWFDQVRAHRFTAPAAPALPTAA